MKQLSLLLNHIPSCLLAGLLVTVTSSAALELASPFTDHMVLQRGMAVPVWGRSDPGDTVTVRFAGQVKSTTTDAGGKWAVSLESLTAAAKPSSMTVRSKEGASSLEISDVLVGEVWICSGQSNMQFGVGGVPEIKALIPKAGNIRSFTVKRSVAFDEQDALEGVWLPQTLNSAVAFSFAYFLEQAADVPVGIILSCWGSSSIEAWMPRDMTGQLDHFKTIMEEFDADTATKERIKAALDGPKPWSGGDDVFLRRQPNIVYNAMMHPLAPYACRGLVWYQGDLKNVHPKDKLPVGRRLALLAARDTLGQQIVAEGPVMKRVELRDSTAIVHYEQAGGMKTRDGKAPTAFWLAGESGKWSRATAKIVGETVVLQSPGVKKPRHVRYGFAGKPAVNLVNGDDLPARPFRTDRMEP